MLEEEQKSKLVSKGMGGGSSSIRIGSGKNTLSS